ncbi:MAG: phenylacetate--CoA ligase, partial [Deltaproteobacteria bacterium CG_4_9_14_3_um_filter_44_9]
LHIFSHRSILEVVDPENGEPLPYGEEGELILTPLLYETMPLIRYRTG